MSRRNEIQVGLTVLVAVAILVGSLAWLKDFSFLHAKRIWRVEFPQTGGLAPSDEVLVNGLRRGRVEKMRLEGDHVIIEISLAKEIVITHDSQVAIRNVGVMGERVISVSLKTSGAPYSTDDLIPGIYEQGLGEVLSQLGGTMDGMADLSNQLRRVAESLSRNDDLGQTVRNFGKTSEELRLTVSENRAALRSAIQDFASASHSAKGLLSDREERLRQALDDFASAAEKMDRLSGRLDSLRAVIQNVSDRVDRGEGTLGKLVQDDQLYADLTESVQSLKALIEDVKAHPKKYFKISVF